MNDLQVFNSPDFGDIRAVQLDGEPWFMAADVCRALDIGNPTQALTRLDDDEVTLISNEGGREVNFVNEPGLYSLVLGSRKKEAKAFKRWITHEVLPSIRKSGVYLTPEAEERVKDIVLSVLADLDLRPQPSGLMSITDIRPALPGGSETFTPGLAARKRWMRTASEKLDLMSARFNATHNQILHSLYQHLEKRFGLVLEEERLRAMEEHSLGDCSTLTAIFFNQELRDAFEDNIDYNLAPENRGW